MGPVGGVLREGARRGLLHVDDDGVRYRHEVQRSAVEASLSPDVRRDLHGRVLAQLDGHADPALLVHHARAAGDIDALVAFAPLAARAAMAAGSHREALAHFRVLGPHLDRLPVADAAGLAEDWVRTAHQFGYADDAVAALPRAVALRRAARDPCAVAQTLSLGVMVHENAGRPSEADAYGAEAVEILEALPPGRELADALTEHARLHMLRGRGYTLAIEALDRAIGVADVIGDDRIAASALTLKGAVLHSERDPRGVALIEQAHARAARGGHRFEEADALMVLAGKAADVRDLSRAMDLVERARSAAVRYELQPLEMLTRAMRAELLLWTGDWQAAEDEASELAGVRANTDPIAWRVMATIAARRGRSEAAATIERMWALAHQMDEMLFIDPAAGVVAEHLWLTDSNDEARLAQLDHVLGRGLHGASAWPSGAFAFWMWKLGRLPTVPSSMPDWYRWTVDGRPDLAVAFWAAQGATYDQAVALMHGDDAQAVQAVRILEDLGADGTARRLRRQLRQRGVRVASGTSRASRDHPAGLTARQAEVLELLADGLGNVEIADRLFVSHRTVENHVAAILSKLNAASRHAAVATARAQGLLASA